MVLTGSVPAPRLVGKVDMNALPIAIYGSAVLAWAVALYRLRPARPSPLTMPVRHPSVDEVTARAGTPDPARAVTPQRVHIEMGGRGRHREVA